MTDDRGQPYLESLIPALRLVQHYAEQVAGKQDLEAMAQRLSAVLGVTAAAIAAATRDFGLSGTAASNSSASGDFDVAPVTGSGGVTLPKMRVLAFGDVATGTDTLSVVKTDIGALAEQATRDGTAGMDWSQIILLVLIVLVAGGLSASALELPPAVSEYIGTETGIISLALYLADKVTSKRRD